MPTGQVIITQALTALGVNRPGYTPNSDDSTDALVELNNLLDSYSADNMFVYGTQTLSGAWVAATASVAIGPSAAAPWNVQRPSRIETAVFIATVGSGATRRRLSVIDSRAYFSQGDLAAAASAPDSLYYDNADPAANAKIYLWPVPSCPTVSTLELEVWAQLVQMSLGGSVNLQPAYQDMLEYRLAFRLIPRFTGYVTADPGEILKLAEGAEDRVRALNAANRFLLNPTAPPDDTTRAYEPPAPVKAS